MLNGRAHRLVSVAEFSNAGSALEVGPCDLVPPSDEQYILRMAIRVDGGEYTIPSELEWLRPMFERAVHSQGAIGIDHPFCYITVRHGAVISKTDDQWHVDGFSTKIAHVPEQNYIWSNVDSTEYADLSVEFPEDFDPRIHNVNHYLEQFVADDNMHKCQSGIVYAMDPYILHRRPPSSNELESRTFVRISFVPIEINDVNNTQNPLLPRTYTQDGVQFRNQLKTY